MLIEHRGKRPRVHPSAFVAPTAVVCGDVTVGPQVQVAFGAILVAEGAPVAVGAGCIVRENAVLRSDPRHPVRVGEHVLVGPHASLIGCTVEDGAFLATRCAIFHGARIGRRAEVRIGGVVHVNSSLPAGTTVPIAWVAVGNPAQILPPHEHDLIWAIQEPLNFPLTAYGVGRKKDGGVDIREVTRRVAVIHGRHRRDRVLREGAAPGKRTGARRRARAAKSGSEA